MKPTPTAQDLAPVAQVLDPEYPASLREITELLYLELVESEPEPPAQDRATDLARLALRQTERMCMEMGGQNLYLHKGTSYRLSPRNRQMCAEFRGDYKSLARKWGLTEQQTRNIVDAWQRERFHARQGSLQL